MSAKKKKTGLWPKLDDDVERRRGELYLRGAGGIRTACYVPNCGYCETIAERHRTAVAEVPVGG